MVLRPSLSALSARAHRPLISFVGKRIWPSSALTPAHPHPAAPPEYRKTFTDIPQQTASEDSSEQLAFRDFWDAPARYWRPKHHALQELEIDAIQSGGASLL